METAAKTAAPPQPQPLAKRTMTYNQPSSCPDMEPEFLPLYERCKPFTMTSLERMYGLFKSVEHVVRNNIPGDLVECGVWKGGSCMLAALALAHFGDTTRDIYLYDTFAGMPAPGEEDVDYVDQHAALRLSEKWPSFDAMANAPLDEVRRNLLSVGYPAERIVFVQGRVEQTIPRTIPPQIALLRLDTDWYESTRHEMDHLYPRLAVGGALIVDDYGHWKGCRRAVDEYVANHKLPLMLHRYDYTGRIGVKP
jgi:O-methyltransferase